VSGIVKTKLKNKMVAMRFTQSDHAEIKLKADNVILRKKRRAGRKKQAR